MNKTISFPLLMLGLIGIAVAIYIFLLAPPEKQGVSVDVLETTQLAAETAAPTLYNEDSSSSPLVVNTISEGVSQMDSQEFEEQYPSEEDESMPPPSGGDW